MSQLITYQKICDNNIIILQTTLFIIYCMLGVLYLYLYQICNKQSYYVVCTYMHVGILK